ncbi:MAG: prolyl oligopeptidase family serine peptidase [Armatimonadetes bacterium]|nr:prolyl oligopeptidase family serine peptidase [Armatimonadota bacterium]
MRRAVRGPRAICALIVAFACRLAAAQEQLSIESLFDGRYSSATDGPIGHWLPGSHSLLSIQQGAVVKIDAESGEIKTLVKAEDLDGFKPETASMTDDKVLLYGNSKKVWRLNTRGDYYVFDLKTRKLRRLGPSKAQSELMFAKISPDGKSAGYVYHNNIYVCSLQTGRIRSITHDGAEKTVNGTFDWVYEEELGLRDGWRWSPDSKQIAFWQLDTSPEAMFTLVDQSNKTQVIKKFPYPQAGTPNARARIGVVSTYGGRVKWMNPKATPDNGYLARMDWAANSKELLIQFLNRRQNQDDYYLVSARTGKEHLIWSDKDPAWVDIMDTAPTGVAWVAQGQKFLTLSERSGQRHLYAVDRNGKDSDLTPGEYDVDTDGIQTAGNAIFFYASPGAAAQRYLYQTSLDNEEPYRLTPANLDGTNSYDISPDGALAIHDYSRLGVPTQRDLVEFPLHRTLRVITANKALTLRVENIDKGSLERRTFSTADGQRKMDAIVVYPPNFDATKKYPVFFEVYGGPAGVQVKDQWLGVQQMLWWLIAQKGYIVCTFDNRGTPALKGRAWRKSIYLNMNPIIAADQAAAARQMAALPYVDSKRIGVWGWSTGGTNTLQALFSYPDIWSLGIAVAPGTDISLYDTIYTERYSGLPKEHPQAYFNDSPVNFVKGLHGDLLVIHGTGDDNCHYQNTEWLIDRLVAEGKQFTMMSYPNRTHEISEGQGTVEHLFNLILGFLQSHMPGGPLKSGS